MSRQTMTVEDILNSARARVDGMSKVASAPQAPAGGAPQDRLVEAVGQVLNSLGQEKTAASSAPTPTPTSAPSAAPAADDALSTLTKMASDLAGAENAALIKEAQLFGAAFTDGMMARAAEWNQATRMAGTPEGEKTAEDHAFEKWAAENPEAVKRAAQEGYSAVTQGLAAYKQGAAQMDEFNKVATAVFHQGYRDAQAVVRALNAQG